MEVRLYIAHCNRTGKQTPEFVAPTDAAGEAIALKLLGCKPDELVMLCHTVDRYGWAHDRINAAMKVKTD